MQTDEQATGSSGSEAARLIARCADGDRAAFRQLYGAWSGRLHGVALRITRDPALAADATHDAFVQVWQQAAKFDPSRGEAASWLMSLSRYRALDLVRRRGREVLGHEPVVEQADVSADPLMQLMQSTEGGALRRCLELLSPERRQLVVLAFVEGFSHSQLAARFAMPIGTVKSWIRRSLLGLKECLAP
jgi:RNA polymerase sigma-70 factor (ECF subfamily)